MIGCCTLDDPFLFKGVIVGTDRINKLQYAADFMSTDKSLALCDYGINSQNQKSNKINPNLTDLNIVSVDFIWWGGSAFQSPDIMGFIFFSRRLWSELHLNINQQERREKKKVKRKERCCMQW